MLFAAEETSSIDVAELAGDSAFGSRTGVRETQRRPGTDAGGAGEGNAY